MVTAHRATKPATAPGIATPPAAMSMNGSIISLSTIGGRQIQDCRAL